MKKSIIFAALAALVLASCAKNEVARDNREDNAIAFSTYNPRTVTRANNTYVSGADFTGSGNQHIGVYAWYLASGQFQGTETAGFLNNEDVTLKTNGTEASDDYNVQYWPADAVGAPTYAKCISFAAYYPYNDAAITAKPEKGLGTYTFKVDADPAKQTDFMVADVEPDMVKPADATVGFTFHHMLTKVQFYMKSDVAAGTAIKVKSLKLAGVNTTGTLTTAYTKADGKTSYTWSAQATPAEFTIVGADFDLTSTEAKLTADSDTYTFLMLPQTLADAAVLTLVYEVKTGTNDAVQNTKTVKINTAKVGTDALTAWAANQNIKYSFKIGNASGGDTDSDLVPIKFKADVAEWDAEKNATVTF